MLDIQFIRDNPEKVKQAAGHKGISVDVDKLLELDHTRRGLLQEVEKLRKARNETAAQMKNGQPSPELVAEGKRIKETLNTLEVELGPVQQQYDELLRDTPNIFSDDTPLGGEEANETVFQWGDSEQKPAKDHVTWLEEQGLVDFERGAKVAGSKFFYAKAALAELESAVCQFALTKVKQHGFTLMSVPHMTNKVSLEGTGFAPRDDASQIYSINQEDLYLIGTAEIPLTAYHQDEIIDVEQLPLLYVALSPCYRREAGTYGKHSKGLYRVHQFYKAEMYVFCEPEESATWHDKLVAIEEEILQDIGIPYRKVINAAGDLGAPAYKKFDIEYFSAVDGEYRELTSCSNVTDYQARRLNIRYRDQEGSTQFVHTLNGTAMVSSRGPIAIIENFQTAEGEVVIPEVLRPFMGGREKL